MGVANQKTVRYLVDKSYFTNISKAFIYITDFMPSLKRLLTSNIENGLSKYTNIVYYLEIIVLRTVLDYLCVVRLYINNLQKHN